MASEIDLKDYIKIREAACLNNDSKTSIDSILSGSGELKSNDETDHQLILTIPFKEKVNLRKLIFKAEPKEDSSDSGPKDIKLWINQNMDFDDAESMKPVQTIELTTSHLEGGAIDLKYTKFQNVSSLIIYIDTNQSDSDVTLLNSLSIIGKPRAGMNMNELKKTG